jgi:uncharacterized lipoprotein
MASNDVHFALLLRAGVLVIAAMAASGCALSPQAVPIEPTLAVDESNIGRGRSIALDAADNRANKIIGSRGGVYASTSTISASGDIQAALRKAMAGALTKHGFTVVDAGAPADMRMLVGLDALTYATQGDPVVRSVEIGTKVSNTVERAGQTYTGRAGITKTRNVLSAPAPEDNEAYINDTLALALEKLLADERYLDFVR